MASPTSGLTIIEERAMTRPSWSAREKRRFSRSISGASRSTVKWKRVSSSNAPTTASFSRCPSALA